MPKLTRTGIDYPAKGQNPFWEIFKRMLDAFDNIFYAHREDRNVQLMGGGTVSWNATTGALDWNADIVLVSPQKGYALSVEPPSPVGSFVLNDGELFYVRMVRAPGQGLVLAAQKSLVVPNNDDALLVARRHGSQLFFRNGRMFNDGDSGLIYISTSGGGGAIAGYTRNQIVVATNNDEWFGTGATSSAATQAALSASFSSVAFAPGSVEVLVNGVASKYVSGVPASLNEWTWVNSGSPQPVVRIGTGLFAGDLVTVHYPTA